MGETIVFDTETDNLLDKMTRLWMLQIGTVDGDDCTIYSDLVTPEVLAEARERGMTAPIRPIVEGAERVRAADKVIGHNLIGFDFVVMERFLPGVLRLEQCVDTLVLACLQRPDERDHTLRAWGERTGTLKGAYRGNFQQLDAELLVYAEQDIPSGRALYHVVKPSLDFGKVVDVEHRFARILSLQEMNGFTLDVTAARELDADLRGDLATAEAALHKAFPPIERTKTTIPKASNSKFGYVKGVSHTKKWMEEFDPGSRQKLAERLEMLGWRPRAFGKDGVATVDEDVLMMIPYPEAQIAVDYFRAQKKLGQLSDGKTGWLKVVRPTGRVHGRVKGIGCASGRCAHSNPNLGNVNKKDGRMRAVWIPRPGWKLVGVDADTVQARGFAHYLARYDGGAFAKKIHEGSKKDRSDAHSANLEALIKASCVRMDINVDPDMWNKARDALSKPALYAVWFGAQDPKLGWTIKNGAKECGLPIPRVPDRELGALARVALMRAVPGYKTLVEAIQATAKKQRYLTSPLGRRIPIRSMHSALVFLMQAIEADIMKMAAVIFHFEVAPANGWVHGESYAYVAHVHDEAQIEARPDIAEALGAAYASCIEKAGVIMNLRCPLKGSTSVGDSWRATH